MDYSILTDSLHSIGIVFQLLAGIILALPYLLPEKWFITADDKLISFIRWPFNNRRKVILFVTIFSLMIVIGFFGFSIFAQTEPVLKWYDNLLIVLLYSTGSAFLYLYLISKLLKIILRNNQRLSSLKRPYLSLISINAGAAIFFGGVLIGALNILYAIVRFINEGNSFPALPIHLLIQILGFSSLAFLYAIVLIILLAPPVIIASIASPVKKPLWGIVLFFFVAGGLLQLANSI